MRDINVTSNDTNVNEDLPLTNLRNSWCSRRSIVSDFLLSLVQYQGI